MSERAIRPLDRVIITDAEGKEHESTALSAVKPTHPKFPIIWVNRPLSDGRFDPCPWPAESVRLAPNPTEDAVT